MKYGDYRDLISYKDMQEKVDNLLANGLITSDEYRVLCSLIDVGYEK